VSFVRAQFRRAVALHRLKRLKRCETLFGVDEEDG
jgi:hypothetical protein